MELDASLLLGHTTISDMCTFSCYLSLPSALFLHLTLSLNTSRASGRFKSDGGCGKWGKNYTQKYLKIKLPRYQKYAVLSVPL